MDQAVTPTRRGEQKLLRTRARLKEAGLRVFLERGVQEASIVEITEAADTGVGTFYLHFKSKDDLFGVLMQDGLGDILAELSRIGETLPPGDQLSALVFALFRGAAAQREIATLAIRESGHDRVGRDLRSVLTDHLARMIDATARFEPVKDGSADLLARQVAGMLMQSIWWWINQDEMSADEMAEQVLRLLSRGLPPGVIFSGQGEEK